MTIRRLIITLENGQEAEGESHIFSDRVTTNDALPGHIVMTYHVYLPITHPMFKKLVGVDATMLEELDKEYKTTAFLVEVQRGLVLTREQYDSLDSYEETFINDRAKIDDLYIEVVDCSDLVFSDALANALARSHKTRIIRAHDNKYLTLDSDALCIQVFH